MTSGGLKGLEDLEEAQRLLQAKLAAIEQKKLALLEAEGAIRTEMQHVEIQISRQKKLLEKTPD